MGRTFADYSLRIALCCNALCLALHFYAWSDLTGHENIGNKAFYDKITCQKRLRNRVNDNNTNL